MSLTFYIFMLSKYEDFFLEVLLRLIS